MQRKSVRLWWLSKCHTSGSIWKDTCSFKRLCYHLLRTVLSAQFWEQAATGPTHNIAQPMATWFSDPRHCDCSSNSSKLLCQNSNDHPEAMPTWVTAGRKHQTALIFLNQPDNTTAVWRIYCSKLISYPILELCPQNSSSPQTLHASAPLSKA